MTLFLLVIIGIGVAYLLFAHLKEKPVIVIQSPSPASPPLHVVSQKAGLEDEYPAPLKNIGVPMRDVRGPPAVPVNVSTSSYKTAYQQVGILTKNGRENPTILPLMGRNLFNGRDKWQYYTVSNTPGAGINSRLPISVNGKSCTGEYGCDSVSNGDTVYVEGYNDTFRATIYENAQLNYIPY
jgi:hypothetical protein